MTRNVRTTTDKSRKHPKPWRRDSVFGQGRRVALCREKRAVWKARLNLHNRAKRLTDKAEKIGNALRRRLGADGRCDPTYETLAKDVGCDTKTVSNALKQLRACGLLLWERRLVRDGWRTAQTSNAYVLTLGDPPKNPGIPCEGKISRQITKKVITSWQQQLIPGSDEWGIWNRDRQLELLNGC